MRKLIKVISRKFLHQKKGWDQNEHKTEKKFLSFMFRKQKLQQSITLRSFSKYQSYAGKTILATSNFEGTQFVIKPSVNEFCTIKQEQYNEQQNGQNKNQNSIQNLYDEPIIPTQVNDRFHTAISQINHIVRELYFHKKKLMEQPPFQWNINLTLWILVLFVVGLIFFEFNDSIERENSPNNNEISTYSYAFCSFIFALVLIGFANLIYALSKPYKIFNFDYHVIQSVSKKLLEENRYFFHQRNYSLVCDIQMTWILLKPKDRITKQNLSQ